jgi:RND superfamily putative drug exporter
MGVIRVMDYGVRLLSRIQEEYRRWPDNARAVSAGLQHTGGLITAAAAIMAAVFVSFALADLVVITAIGIGMGVAVVVDATVVRMLLVPGTMRLLGRWNWWAPARFTRGCLPPARELGRLELDGAPAPGNRQRPARPSRTP